MRGARDVKRWWGGLAQSAAIAASAGLVGVAWADEDLDAAIPFEVVARLAPGQTPGGVASAFGLTLTRAIPEARIYLFRASEEDTSGVASDMRNDPRVEFAEQTFEANDSPGGSARDFFLVSTRPQLDSQFWPITIGVPAAQASFSGAGVTVAVLDTGVQGTHPLLAGAVMPGGFDFITGTAGAGDTAAGEFQGHGTFVAGLIRQVAPGAAILPVGVLDATGRSTSFTIAQGVYFALANGARVINLSLGTTEDLALIRLAVADAVAAGAIVVASAGNEGREQPIDWPAAAADVIGVAAVDSGDVLASFSNYGVGIDVVAPGIDVISSSVSPLYASSSGTSYAAPIVAGTVALMLERRPGLSVAEAEAALRASAVNVDAINPDFAGKLGAGRVRVDAAVAAVCRADVAEPFGRLDIFDIFGFFALFGAGDLVADLTGDGQLNIMDIFGFFDAFGRGC